MHKKSIYQKFFIPTIRSFTSQSFKQTFSKDKKTFIDTEKISMIYN